MGLLITQEPIRGGITVVDDAVPVTVSIHRRPIKLIGNAHDIDRVMTACKDALRRLEHNRLDPEAMHNVNVAVPSSNEP